MQVDAGVEFGHRHLDVDFRHAQDVVRRKRLRHEVAALADENHRGDCVLFKDDVALDRGGSAVFAQFLDAVGTGGAFAEDLEHDDRVVDYGGPRRDR